MTASIAYVHVTLVFLHHIFSSFCQTDVIYLDLSKTLDTVSHHKLLKDLWSYGITGNLWMWIKSYLTNRLQYISINSHKSSLLQVRKHPWSLYFIIYVNDLSIVINNSQFLGYPDDTKCYKHTVTPYDQQLLQDVLNSLFDWSKFVDLSFRLQSKQMCPHICISPHNSSILFAW